jgi:hypothetical protein
MINALDSMILNKKLMKYKLFLGILIVSLASSCRLSKQGNVCTEEKNKIEMIKNTCYSQVVLNPSDTIISKPDSRKVKDTLIIQPSCYTSPSR